MQVGRADKKDRFELKKENLSRERPPSTATSANIDRIRKLIKRDCQMSCSDIADELEIPKICVYRILIGVLDLRNVYSQWIPHKLNERNKAARVQCCKDLPKIFREKGMEYILSHYGVDDETWVNCSEKSKMTSNLSFVMIQKPYRKPCSAV